MFGAALAVDEHADGRALHAVARDFSPRIEACSEREVLIDLGGLERLIGDPPTIAAELQRTAAGRGLHVRVAIARTRTAARLLVHGDAAAHAASAHGAPARRAPAFPPSRAERASARPAGALAAAGAVATAARTAMTSAIAIEPDDVRGALAPLPIHLLHVVAEDADLLTLRRWGLATLGDLADLPGDALAARLGQRGVAWQRLARGDDPGPLIPAVPEERFEQSLDLEWPIDSLEPLSFVLGRLLEPLSAHLERRDRGAAVLHVTLHLVKSAAGACEVHARSLELPAPVRDARTLRTLALLDLESHPPSAPVDRVVVAVDPTPGRVVQFSLLARPLPSPDQISTLMARLHALMGEGRCGSPQAVDSWQPGAFAMNAFAPRDAEPGPPPAVADHDPPPTALRRFRVPLPVRMRLEEGRPARVTTDRRGLAGGRITTCAGPWRTSGAWWDSHLWNRDEWDITLAEGETYRVFQDRESGHWFLDGVVD